MENVTDAIEHAEADLVQTRDELRMARELVASLEQDAKRIEIELVGLRSYAQRRGLAEPSATAIDIGLADTTGFGQVVPINADVLTETTPAISNLLTMSRNEAVATVMASSPRPMDRNAIHEQLALNDRDESVDDVSLSLSGLKRAGRVEKLGRGLWRLVEESATGS